MRLGGTRRSMLCVALGGLMAAGAAPAAQAGDPRERLIVSVMALRDGALVADDAGSYTPFHKHREQLLSLDVGGPDQPLTVLVTIWDRDAGGVQVEVSLLNRDGASLERRAFTMYPFLDLASSRTEALRLPVNIAAEGDARRELWQLAITMKRVMRL
jgi:hypothetical protein